MQTLREIVQESHDARIGVGHFNVSDSNQLNAVVEASHAVALPVIIGASEGERKFFGIHALSAVVASMRAQGNHVYLNADHTYSVELVKEAIDAGCDAVIFDGSHLSLEENIAQTRAAVAYARASGRDVLVEGEIGRIGTSSKLLDKAPEDIDTELTTPDDAAQFVRETGVDLLAPAVGTMHGRLKSGPMPRINAQRIEEIREATGIPLVLHGGSGSTDEDFVAAVKAGISIVHINTDIRIAYRKGIEAGLSKDADEIAPYRFLQPGVDGVRAETERYLKLFALK
ncbi:MAG: class II fructose-bisphosphate aldolase [Minisyncoccota bacterium]